MRLRYAMFVAIFLAACNSILGNTDYRLVEATGGAGGTGGTESAPATCRLNSNCATGDVCLFETCGPPCNGDQDCAKGSRCLQTDTGTACVSASAATCDAGCPAGTTCSPKDGVCRNACDTQQCLTDQVCSAGLCVGSDQHEAAGALELGGGGAGGAPDTDTCVGVVCNTPPSSDCDSGNAFKTYDKMGSCSAGVCTYTEHLIPCSCAAGKCTTDPCIAVTCASPPDASCKDADTLTTYAASGTCDAGSCSYAPKDKACDFGCSNGACKPDPCVGKTCSTPPATTCKNASTQTTYAATGSCSAGTCSYTPTDKVCDTNQQCAGAGPCAVCKADASCGASCSACAAGNPKCKDLGATSKCVACLADVDCSGSSPVCDTMANVCVAARSCIGLAKTCGAPPISIVARLAS